jgi:hypothetical protein
LRIAKQTEVLDVLVDLFRQSRKDTSEARTAFLSVALLLARQNVLDYLVAALLTQARKQNEEKRWQANSSMAYGVFVSSESSAVSKSKSARGPQQRKSADGA